MGILQSSTLNPFNHFGAVKILPAWMGFRYINAGPKALANKADQKMRRIRNQEADLLISQMNSDAKSGMYFNVYQIHGVAWGRVEAFLKRRGFLYMYDHGSAKTEYQMCVAVCWIHESKWTANGNVRFFEVAIAHFIGECIAAACCDTLSPEFAVTLVKTVQKKFVNPKSSQSERETQEVNAMVNILEHIILVAMEMSKYPDKSKPIMNVAISKNNAGRILPVAVKILGTIMLGYGKAAVSTHAAKVIREICVKLPGEIAAVSKKELDEKLQMKADKEITYNIRTI